MVAAVNVMVEVPTLTILTDVEVSLPTGLLRVTGGGIRSEEHTSELQSPCNFVCRLLLEKMLTTSARRLVTHPLPPHRPVPVATTSGTIPSSGQVVSGIASIGRFVRSLFCFICTAERESTLFPPPPRTPHPAL